MGSMTQECERIRLTNAIYISMFQKDLEDNGLKSKTIEKHCNNVNFYLNVYLLREEANTMESGTRYEYLNGFLGDFFIRKCMWSSPATLKSTSTSIKKFYKSMLEHGHISDDNYLDMKEVIQMEMDGWLRECEEYNKL